MFWYLGPGSVSGSCREMLLAAAPSERYLKSVIKKSSTTSFHPTFECPSSSSQRPPKLHCGLSTSGALERPNCIFKIVDALSKIGDSPSLLFLNICPRCHVIDLSVNVYTVLNVFSKICFVARVILFLSRTCFFAITARQAWFPHTIFNFKKSTISILWAYPIGPAIINSLKQIQL